MPLVKARADILIPEGTAKVASRGITCPSMYINKKQILETFLRITDHISDKEYQKRIWIRGEGPECDDFDETVCNFFQDGNGILKNYRDFGLTEDQYELLKQFRDEFEAFSDENDWPADFINTLEWNKVVEVAKEVLVAFNYQKRR